MHRFKYLRNATNRINYYSSFAKSFFSKYFLILFCIISSSLLVPHLLTAGGMVYWTPNGIKLSDKRAYPSDIISDEKGGAIVILDGTAINDSIYAQRVNGGGNLLWGSNGVFVGGSYLITNGAKAVSDGKGGVIVVWERYSGLTYLNLFAQRLDSTGVMMWNPNGVLICNADSDQCYPAIVSDGAGGAIIVWQDGRNGTSGRWDIYAQRIDSIGNVKWLANGVPMCTATGQQERPSLCSDGEKGAVVVWFDTRNDVYAQRIDSNGIVQWGATGKTICATVNYEGGPSLSLIDTNGIIIAWMDNRNANYDIYAQRINLNGDTLWPGGVAICTAESLQGGQKIIKDDHGGAIILWYDKRLNGLYDLYIQRTDSDGIIKWLPNGVSVCTNDSTQQYPALTSDNASGAIIAWEDKRNYGSNRWDVYAQHVDSSGNVLWDTNGMVICTAQWSQGSSAITTDMAGGAIIAWGDNRDLAGKTYAQRVGDEPSGITEKMQNKIYIMQNVKLDIDPNPFTNSVNIEVKITDSDVVTFGSKFFSSNLRIYNVTGQLVKEFKGFSGPDSQRQIIWNGTDDHGRTLPNGIYFIQYRENNDTETEKIILLR